MVSPDWVVKIIFPLFSTIMTDYGDVKVYTVNGATAGSSSSLPDWLTRKRAVKGKSRKRAVREHVEGTIELIQGFEFPEASNRVKTTRDGHHVMGTGTYKPQMRVWDLDQLSMKFERHTDAENVDFVVRECQVPRPPPPLTSPRFSPMTGLRASTFKTTARSSCIRRAASTTAREYLGSGDRWRTTSPPATRTSRRRVMRSTASTSNLEGS